MPVPQLCCFALERWLPKLADRTLTPDSIVNGDIVWVQYDAVSSKDGTMLRYTAGLQDRHQAGRVVTKRTSAEQPSLVGWSV